MKVYQIEISNYCNLTCAYCPQPFQRRPYGFMSWETYKKAIQLVQECGQSTVYLHNFGEPLLHPLVTDFVRYATDRGLDASFFTNGTLIDEASLRALYGAGLRRLCISEHTKGEADRVAALIASAGLPIAISEVFRPVRAALHNWAGQTRVRVRLPLPPPPHGPCIFERQQAAVVLWDGTLNVCCIDAEGEGAQGSVDKYLGRAAEYTFRPISRCSTCSLMRGEEQL